ncbi:hypothetical protein GLYMA_18G166500v4 [Glycine max]|uniref:Uncharacterized protein n=1 Tax=Glycine max TaxID=3847 RepID=A0A0R0F0P3_SOYBN|nr:hypothetical protein GYH30_050194 [Glycine max]KRG99724.1 hypothetical protein GLYMA_18G166500v4 [Glycine max]
MCHLLRCLPHHHVRVTLAIFVKNWMVDLMVDQIPNLKDMGTKCAMQNFGRPKLHDR